MDHEIQRLDLGDQLLPWLKRLQSAINQQPGIDQQRFYAKKILNRLTQLPIATTEFMVDSERVLGREPGCAPEDRIEFEGPESFMFFGRLATFGSFVPPEQNNILLSLSFGDTEPITYIPPSEVAEDFSALEFEVIVPEVKTLVSVNF